MLCRRFDINLFILKQDFFHLGFLPIALKFKRVRMLLCIKLHFSDMPLDMSSKLNFCNVKIWIRGRGTTTYTANERFSPFPKKRQKKNRKGYHTK